MTALVLLRMFDSIYLVALIAWVGSILFFSFGVAPIVFKVLSPNSAARFLRAIFPRYYAWGAIWCAVALASFVCGPLAVPELRGRRVAAQEAVLIACILIMLYCGNVLVPAINAARDSGPAGDVRFQRLHRRSVALNLVALVAGLCLAVAFAVRPAPRTAGIIEPSPAERLMRETQAERDKQSQRDAPSPPSAAIDRSTRP